MPYNEQVANESTGNDLLFEVLGDVVGSEVVQSIRGTIVGDTPPEDTNYLWVDKSSDVASIKFYDEDEKAWNPISLGTGGGSGSIDNSTSVELDSDIEE